MSIDGKLSDKKVAALKTKGLHSDGRGLYLQVTPPRGKSWLLKYQDLVGSGKVREMGLGPYPDVTLAEAREAALQCRKQVRAGIDPIEARQAKRTAAKLARQGALTFAKAAEQYIKGKEAGWRDPKTGTQWRQSLRDHVFPVLGKMPIADIDMDDVLRVIEPMWSTKTVTATRVRSRIEAVIGYAMTKRYRPLGDNPAKWDHFLENTLPNPSDVAKVKHHAALPYQEIGAFMDELRQQQGVAARALEFLVLTAARVGEVCGAKWQEINEKDRIWTIPAFRMKAKREHTVPLSGAALAIIEALNRDGDEIIFSGAPKIAVWRTLRTLHPTVTIHGFRASFRSWCGDCGVPREVAEQALAHRLGDSAELAYIRSSMIERRRVVMSDWAKFCDSPQPTGETVVPMPRWRVAGE
jgi:integrase